MMYRATARAFDENGDVISIAKTSNHDQRFAAFITSEYLKEAIGGRQWASIIIEIQEIADE